MEMEAAAIFAVAQYRKVILAQILYGGDDVSCDEWDPAVERSYIHPGTAFLVGS
ncbi:MAG TPA: hypothetical protein PL004_06325 [Bacillota bacterium]|nr:hypothetical protein [Bacillota bacterium]